MKLEVPTISVNSNLDCPSYSMKLDNDSYFLFENLRKTLYKDPVRAICREITSNALDANREAGRANNPVRIKLPGDYLEVSDDGPGISPDRIENVYCYYGRSTKTDDNNMIGAYGLGAKSPFSICEAFFIITVFDGIKYQYLASIDDFRGSIKLLSQNETNESSGTTIKVPIRYTDRILFKNAMLNATAFWKVKPKIYNQYGAEIPDLGYKPSIDDEKWAIFTTNIGNVNLLVGNIPYSDYDHNIPNKVVLKLKIGEIDLDLSREAPRYTQKTHDAIKAALAAYYTDIFDKAQADISTVEKFSDVVTIIDSLPKPQAGVFEKEWTWQGFKFKYPLTEPIHIYERPRNRLVSYVSKLFGGDVTNNNVIIKDKKEITSYDRQKISYFLNTNAISRVYLIPAASLPIEGVNLSSIRIKRASGPRGPRAKKTKILGKSSNARVQQHFLIESPTDIIYVTRSKRNKWAGQSQLGVAIVTIKDEDEKHIIDQDTWIELDEYIQQKIDLLGPVRAQEIIDWKKFQGEYYDLKFLATYCKDFEFILDNERKKFDEKDIHFVDFLERNGKIKATPDKGDLKNKYPMLKMLKGWIYEEEKKIVINYVNSIAAQEQGESEENAK